MERVYDQEDLRENSVRSEGMWLQHAKSINQGDVPKVMDKVEEDQDKTI